MFDQLTWGEKTILRRKMLNACHALRDEAVNLSGAPATVTEMYQTDATSYLAALADVAGIVLATYPPMDA